MKGLIDLTGDDEEDEEKADQFVSGALFKEEPFMDYELFGYQHSIFQDEIGKEFLWDETERTMPSYGSIQETNHNDNTEIWLNQQEQQNTINNEDLNKSYSMNFTFSSSLNNNSDSFRSRQGCNAKISKPEKRNSLNSSQKFVPKPFKPPRRISNEYGEAITKCKVETKTSTIIKTETPKKRKSITSFKPPRKLRRKSKEIQVKHESHIKQEIDGKIVVKNCLFCDKSIPKRSYYNHMLSCSGI